MKTCKRCSRELPVTEYHRDSSRPDGLAFYCKECDRAQRADYWQRNKARKSEYDRNRRQEKAEQIKAQKRDHYQANIGQARAKKRAYYHRNKSRIRAAQRAKYDPMRERESKYGLPAEQYVAMAEQQQGRCAICGKQPTGIGRAGLVVDHDHTTGQVRGLLCSACNTGLGKLGDTAEALERALAYLRPPR